MLERFIQDRKISTTQSIIARPHRKFLPASYKRDPWSLFTLKLQKGSILYLILLDLYTCLGFFIFPSLFFGWLCGARYFRKQFEGPWSRVAQELQYSASPFSRLFCLSTSSWSPTKFTLRRPCWGDRGKFLSTALSLRMATVETVHIFSALPVGGPGLIARIPGFRVRPKSILRRRYYVILCFRHSRGNGEDARRADGRKADITGDIIRY